MAKLKKFRDSLEDAKSVFPSKCKFCGTNITLDSEDLHYCGHYRLAWTCPICCMGQVENIERVEARAKHISVWGREEVKD